MSFPSAAGGVCTTCGSSIVTTASGDLGCLSCLLRTGSEDEFVEPTTSATPASFGAYVIARHEDGSLHELGRGAMGVTFLAEDVSLQRPVALKIIKADFGQSGSDARERFMREARAAAALRHPNVATVYQFGMDDETGQYFCAMELVEGETLEERVRRTGPLDSPTVVELARQVTAALAAAEARGLVHRDLKPGNIMVASESEDGKIAVKVIDFGVAKALQDAPDTRTLTHGGFVGTPAFASPEQLWGKSIDVRSDIYSLGVTLWFLLTGKMPFGKDHPRNGEENSKLPALRLGELKAAHLPTRFSSLLVGMLATEPAARPRVRELTSRLEKIHAQLTEKRKTRRHLALAVALITLAASGAFFVFHSTERGRNKPAPAPTKSIAVLPFEDLSDEKNNAYFADGIQDDLLTSLAKIQDLKVISRTSVMSFRKNGGRNVREIGKELGAANVVEGTVRRVGNRVLVNVQLIDTTRDQHIWAERYDRTLRDTLTLQGELASEIAGALRATLSPDEKARLETNYTDNPDAYVAYLRGREAHLRSETSRENFLTAEGFYKQALALDPRFVLARARLSYVQTRRYQYFEPTNEALLSEARSHAEAAIRLDGNSAEAHVALANWAQLVGEETTTRRELALATRLLPNDASVLLAAAMVQGQLEWNEEAAANYKRAAELSPREPAIFFRYGQFLRFSGHKDEARAALDRALELAPESVLYRLYRAHAEISWTGDLGRVKGILSGLPPGKDPDGRATSAHCTLAVLERDYTEALRLLRTYSGETLPTVGSLGLAPPESKAVSEGLVFLFAGDRVRSYERFDSSRWRKEVAVRDKPQSPDAHRELAVHYALMGWKEAAMTEAARVIALENSAGVPLERRGFLGLAQAYAWIAEPDLALQQLEQQLATNPSYTASNDLSIHPIWDPLRRDPRFQALLTRHQTQK